jgi:hypothetical protein
MGHHFVSTFGGTLWKGENCNSLTRNPRSSRPRVLCRYCELHAKRKRRYRWAGH